MSKIMTFETTHEWICNSVLVMYEAEQNVQKSATAYQTAVDAQSSRSYAVIFFSSILFLRNESKFVLLKS